MILYKENPIPFKLKNIMMLDVPASDVEGDKEPVVYVSKNTYDQCVRMYARLDGEIGYVCRVVGVDYAEGTVVDWYHKNAPTPVNILAPFIGVLIKDGAQIEIGEMEKCFGYLHILSQLCNFDAYTQVNADIRADLTVGKSVLNSYKESWEDLEQSLYDRVPVALMPTQVVAGTMVATQATESVTAAVDPNIDLFDEEAEISEEDWVAQMDALLAQAEAETAAEEAAAGKEPEKEIVTSPANIVGSTQGMSEDEVAQEQSYANENAQIANMFSKFVGA